MKNNMTAILFESLQEVNEGSYGMNRKAMNTFNETVSIDEPSDEEIAKDDAEIKAQNKKDLEERLGDLKLMLQNGEISEDEKENIKNEIKDLEDALNECVENKEEN